MRIKECRLSCTHMLCVGMHETRLIAQMLLPFSKFFPLALTYGLVLEPGVPGAAPKCFFASLSFGPLRSKVFVPNYNN